jgi:hypothetical protein
VYGASDELFTALFRHCKAKKYRVTDILAEMDKSRSNSVPMEELCRFLKKIVPDVTAGQLKRFSEHVDPMAVGRLPYQAVVDGMKHADPTRSLTRAPTYLQVCVCVCECV